MQVLKDLSLETYELEINQTSWKNCSRQTHFSEIIISLILQSAGFDYFLLSLTYKIPWDEAISVILMIAFQTITQLRARLHNNFCYK